MKDQDSVIECSECGSDSFIRGDETGEDVCARCGVVYSSNNIDFGPEWRAFTLQQRENLPRTGAPTTLLRHDRGLSTVIDWKGIDGTGKRMNQSQKYKFYRLRKWNTRTSMNESKQRSLAIALSYISNMGEELNLPKNVVETASSIYRKIICNGTTRGRTIKCLAASAIYAACRQCNVIRTIDDIAEVTEYSKKEIARTYRFLHNNIEGNIPLYTHKQYISKFINQLRLYGETERIALKLLSEASEQQLTVGRSPRGITASCVYIACHMNGEKRNQREVAEVAQITEVTIRNRYKEIVDKLNLTVKI